MLDHRLILRVKFMRRFIIIIAGILIAANCMAATHYVVTNGTPGHLGPADPYTNWATAGTNIIDVVNAAMTNDAARLVWVSNGIYYLTNQASITNALTIRSVNGRDVTIVDGNYPVCTNRCFYLTNNAILDGFTITNGYMIGSGGGVYCSSGTYIQNCRITDCTATNTTTSYGGGAYVAGVMTNCEIIRNRNLCSVGGGICLAGGSLVKCIVAANTVDKGGSGGTTFGAGIEAVGGTISNCVICGNSNMVAGGSGAGGGIRMSTGAATYNSLVYNNYTASTYGGGIALYTRGTILNCTVVSNRAGARAGGIYALASTPYTDYIKNVICYYNTGASGYSNVYFDGAGSYHIVNSCVAPTNALPTSGLAGYYYTNNIESNPRFIDKDIGNWRLNANSPCVNTGTNDEWMTGTVDLDGRYRIRYGTVDMGAYETIYEGTICRIGF